LAVAVGHFKAAPVPQAVVAVALRVLTQRKVLAQPIKVLLAVTIDQ
jgi:hypothetical protein